VLAAYPRATVVAEKFQAMVALGFGNSRMKDFFDLWVLSREFHFDGEELARAISATFRRTALSQKNLGVVERSLETSWRRTAPVAR
jgi:hypothetical protein